MITREEQELVDAFSSIQDVHRSIFNFKVLVSEGIYSKKDFNKIMKLVANLQMHELEVLRRIEDLRKFYIR